MPIPSAETCGMTSDASPALPGAAPAFARYRLPVARGVVPAAALFAALYPLFAHLALSSIAAAPAQAAVMTLALAATLPAMAKGRATAFALLAALLAGVVVAGQSRFAAGLVLLPPVALNVALATLFGRTLRAGAEPLVSRFARIFYDVETPTELPAGVAQYTRSVTFVWTIFFVSLALLDGALAMVVESRGWWALVGYESPLTVSAATWTIVAGLGTFWLSLALMAMEFAVRLRRFPGSLSGKVGFARSLRRVGDSFRMPQRDTVPTGMSSVGTLLLAGHAVPLALALVSLPAFVVLLAIFHIALVVMTLSPSSTAFGPVLRQHPDGRSLWLTIDDGPSKDTKQLLAALAEANATATFFFVADRAAARPELVREVLAAGHGVGNHSASHPSASFWWLRAAQAAREVHAAQATLTEICGQAPRWFRSVAGHTNPFVAAAAAEAGLVRAGWTARGFDSVDADVERVLGRITAKLEPGAIALIHERLPNGRSLAVLAGVLAAARERGLAVCAPITAAAATPSAKAFEPC